MFSGELAFYIVNTLLALFRIPSYSARKKCKLAMQLLVAFLAPQHHSYLVDDEYLLSCVVFDNGIYLHMKSSRKRKD